MLLLLLLLLLLAVVVLVMVALLLLRLVAMVMRRMTGVKVAEQVAAVTWRVVEFRLSVQSGRVRFLLGLHVLAGRALLGGFWIVGQTTAATHRGASISTKYREKIRIKEMITISQLFVNTKKLPY